MSDHAPSQSSQTTVIKVDPGILFSKVAQWVIDSAQRALESGGLFKSNVTRTEEELRWFCNMLVEYSAVGTVQVGDHDVAAMRSVLSNADHLLRSQPHGKTLAQEFGYSEQDIVMLRLQKYTLEPIVKKHNEARIDLAVNRSVHGEGITRGRGR